MLEVQVCTSIQNIHLMMGTYTCIILLCIVCTHGDNTVNLEVFVAKI